MKKQNSLMSIALSLITLVFAIVPLASTLVAQVPAQAIPVGANEVQAGGIAGAPGMAMPSKEKMGGAKLYQLLNQYAIEIGRIDAAVKLEDAQKSKLTDGAKGFAQEKAQEFARNMGAMMTGGVIPVGGTAAAVAKSNEQPVKFDEVKSFSDLDMTTKMMLENMFSPEVKPHDDADWLKLVKSVLKSDQYLKYEQAIAAQKQNKDKAMIDAGMATLNVDLVLSKDQESKLTALVLEQMAKPKPEPRSDAAGMVHVVGDTEGMRFFMEFAKVDSKKIRDVLDPQQFELLDLKLENYRRFAADMVPGVIIVP